MIKLGQNNEALIREWQLYLSKSQDVSYSPDSLGTWDDDLGRAIRELETTLQALTGSRFIGKLISSDNTILTSPASIQTIRGGRGAGLPREQDPKILEFKRWLAQKGVYRGDVNDPTPDEEFIGLIQKIEGGITADLQAIDPSAPSLVGFIWQGSRINPNTSAQDIEKALQVILQHRQTKQAQATVDTFDVEEYQESPPIATKLMPNKEDHGGENGDPLDTQQTGELGQEVTKKMPFQPPEKVEKIPMDERVLGLAEIMSAVPK